MFSMILFQSSSNNYLLSFINGMDRKFKENSCLKTSANSGLITQVYRNSMSLFTRYAQIWLQLFRYNDDLHGAIVSFDKNSIRPTSSTTSLANSPADAFLHFTIKVDIILFAPKAGIYLSGECTEVNC